MLVPTSRGAEIGAYRGVNVRVPDLHGDLGAIWQLRAVHLADRGDRHGGTLQVRQQSTGATAEVGADGLLDLGEGSSGRLPLQVREQTACLLRHVELEVAHDLPELHGQALQVAKPCNEHFEFRKIALAQG